MEKNTHGRAILLGLRTGLDLYVNYRPLFLPGATVHLYRENTEGLYAGVGGTVAGTAVDACVYTRPTVERFVRYCLRDLSGKGHRRVTLVHKANAVPHTGRLWQQVFHAELAAFPELTATEEYVDSFCYHLIRDPSRYEGVLTENLFGDIASDIGAALMGGLGFAASANLCPETGFGLFEPVHGSAPDIAGTDDAEGEITGGAACEASIASGRPVVVFVTTGPGLTNVLTGVYASRHEPARVIVVSASTESAMYGRRPIQETGPRTLPWDGIFTAGPLFDFAATWPTRFAGWPGPRACRSWPPPGARASSPRTTPPTSA
jgi:hypothetical protein